MPAFLIVIFVLVLPSCSGREQPVDSRLSSPRESGDLPHSVSDPNGIRDTVVEKSLFLGESFSVGRMIWMVDVTQPVRLQTFLDNVGSELRETFRYSRVDGCCVS